MLRESLRFPRSGDDWIKSVVIGGILSAVGSFLLVPLLPVQGYFVRVLRGAASGADEPPVFEEWDSLFVDGIKLLVVQVVYVLVPLVVVFIGLAVGGFGAFSEFGGTSTGAAIEVVGWGFILAGSLLTLVAVYLVPAAIANFAYKRRFGAAFGLGTVVEAAFTAAYLRAVVLAFLVGMVLGGIAAVLSVVIVGVVLVFYVQVSIYYLIGRGYAGGLGFKH